MHRLTVISCALAVLLAASQASAQGGTILYGPYCHITDQNLPPPAGTVDCNAPEAVYCLAYISSGDLCYDIGFTNYVRVAQYGGDHYTLWSNNSAVPELEEYAAALFLVIALWIGWRAHRRGMTAAG